MGPALPRLQKYNSPEKGVMSCMLKQQGIFSVLTFPNLKSYLLTPTWTAYDEAKAIHISAVWLLHSVGKVFILLHNHIIWG